MTKYTVDENMLTALESFIKLLNSKDLNEVGQANKALPAIITAMRMFPEEPIYSPQKGYAHAIYNTEIGSLKNMLCSFGELPRPKERGFLRPINDVDLVSQPNPDGETTGCGNCFTQTRVPRASHLLEYTSDENKKVSVGRPEQFIPSPKAGVFLHPKNKGMEILNEVGARANLTVKCQCGLDKPCSEGDSLLQGKPCSAGFASCYVLDERKDITEKSKKKNVVC